MRSADPETKKGEPEKGGRVLARTFEVCRQSTHDLGEAFLKADLGLPAEPHQRFLGIESISLVMAWAVLDMLDEGLRFAQSIEDRPCHSNIGALAVAGKMIDFAGFSPLPGGEEALTVIIDVDPIASLQAIAIDGQGLVSEGPLNEQGNELFGMLARAVIIRAARDHRLGAVGAGRCQTEKVGGSLRGGIGRARVQGRGFLRFFRRGDGAIHFVGGAVEQRDSLPTSGLEEGGRSADIGGDEVGGIGDRPIDMGLGSEMQNARDRMLCDQILDQLLVADIALDEVAAGILLGQGQVGPIARVGQLIEDDQAFQIGLFEQVAGEAGADEAGSTREKNRFQTTHEMVRR